MDPPPPWSPPSSPNETLRRGVTRLWAAEPRSGGIPVAYHQDCSWHRSDTARHSLQVTPRFIRRGERISKCPCKDELHCVEQLFSHSSATRSEKHTCADIFWQRNLVNDAGDRCVNTRGLPERLSEMSKEDDPSSSSSPDAGPSSSALGSTILISLPSPAPTLSLSLSPHSLFQQCMPGTWEVQFNDYSSSVS